MLYEIWSDFGSDNQNCHAVTDNISSAERFFNLAKDAVMGTVSVMVFVPGTDDVLYELDFE